MRFYVLSDLHFECNTDVECVKNNLSRLCEEIRTSEYDRTILFVVLCELIPCIFDKDFVDNDFHDLYSSLTRAFIECGKLSPEQTICMIEKYIPADESENRKLRFCNYITEAIKQQVRMSEDKAKTKVEVKKILQNFCF